MWSCHIREGNQSCEFRWIKDHVSNGLGLGMEKGGAKHKSGIEEL